MTTAQVAGALIALSLLDHGFCGYRAAAGRDGRIFKWGFHLRALRGGLAQGAATVFALGALTALVVGVARAPRALWFDLGQTGEVLVYGYGAYAALVVGAFAPYVFAGMELRTLATVSVLGPMTLLRPYVIVGAGVVAATFATDGRTSALLVLAVGAHLAAEPIMDRWLPRYTYGVDAR